MSKALAGRRVLTIVSNYGVEHDELVVPLAHLRSSGAAVTLAAVKKKKVQTLVGDKELGDRFKPDVTLDDVDPAKYDLLLIPGGTLNADALRLSERAMKIVRSFTSSGRPVAAICHGPWALVTADAVNGKTLTSYASLQTDILNAGAAGWKDEPVVVDDAGGYTLITSRDPDDLDEFLGAIDTVLG